MNVTWEQIGASMICHLDGNLEHLTVGAFRDAASQIRPNESVIFDLSGVPFLDSAGLGALIGAVRRVREEGGEAVICAPRRSVNRVLEMVGLPRIVAVASSVPDALGHLSAVV
ncbi:MAG TPA: STAS domain-containing protein [Acidimicrobiales bacterium]|nr:STAS domain-containing protein [Acidimicrobiales bacterium]